MFVGHEFLAFALAGWGAYRFGRGGRSDTTREETAHTALALGAVAALAALLPDLDVVYAAATYALAVGGGAPLGWEAFWGVANGVHRVVTHPLPVGAVATLVFGAAIAVARGRSAVASRSRTRQTWTRIGLAGLLALASATVLLSAFRTVVSPQAALVAGAFLACVGVVGALVGRRTDLSALAVALAAGVGFLTHPFGDVFLAAPPPLFSPFGPPVLTARVSLAGDPTLDLLGVLFVEIAAVWAGVAVFSRVRADRFGPASRLRTAIDPRPALGTAYAGAAFVLPRPTIADAHVLGFTIVPLAVVVAVWVGHGEYARAVEADRLGDANASRRVDAAFVGLVAGLSTLTVAALGYAVVYLFL